MDDTKMTKAPEDGPNGVDRWTSNGYGLCIDGIEVTSPAEKEADHSNEEESGNQAQEHAPDER